jgi:ABC-type phosphate/phosphonate transport system substrate-binding protein
MGGKHVITGGLVVALAISLAFSTPGPAPARGEASATVRVGIVATLFRDTPEPLMQTMMRPFKSLMEAQTGVAGQFVAGGDAEQLARALKDDRVQLGVFHGFEFGWARLKLPELRPLVIAVNQSHSLHALLVVRSDRDLAGPADLRGQAVALPKLSREHCRLFFERRCVPPGEAPEKYFKVANPANPVDALDDVVDGQAQAAVVDGAALALFRDLKPGRADRLKTLLRSEEFPCAVIASYPGALSEALLERFREGMIAARSTRRGKELLGLCRITRFDAVPENYDQMLSDIIKAYPPVAEK